MVERGGETWSASLPKCETGFCTLSLRGVESPRSSQPGKRQRMDTGSCRQRGFLRRCVCGSIQCLCRLWLDLACLACASVFEHTA